MISKFRNSTLVAGVAILSSSLVFGLLSSNALGRTIFLYDCFVIDPCPGADICDGIPDDLACSMCEFQYSQKDCNISLFSTCNNQAPTPPGEENCGKQYSAFCLTDLCDFDPILDVVGTCRRRWCV